MAPNSCHCYSVRAYNAGGESPNVGWSYVQTLGAPGNLRVAVTGRTSVRLYWTDGSVNETGFQIYVGGRYWTSTTANAINWPVSYLQPNTYYCFRIRAYQGSSSYSNYTGWACATTAS